jgi:hypothetical protein
MNLNYIYRSIHPSLPPPAILAAGDEGERGGERGWGDWGIFFVQEFFIRWAGLDLFSFSAER